MGMVNLSVAWCKSPVAERDTVWRIGSEDAVFTVTTEGHQRGQGMPSEVEDLRIALELLREEFKEAERELLEEIGRKLNLQGDLYLAVL